MKTESRRSLSVACTIREARDHIARARKAGRTIALVPTMGALHAGHVSLIDAAVKQGGYVVVSIFVNPTQFGPTEDLDRYPRNLNADMLACAAAGADLIFAPSVAEMYPDENLTWVEVAELTDTLCGAFRPRHFRGVATVCTKLFNIVQPDVAFFGQKDAQQTAVIRRMVHDLNFPLEIVVCPTVREPDGLAMSSRNRYLTPAERKDAPLLYQALCRCEQMVRAGERDSATLVAAMQETLARSAAITPQYIQIVDADTLEDVPAVQGRVLVALAVILGSTRLIDNIIVDLNAAPANV